MNSMKKVRVQVNLDPFDGPQQIKESNQEEQVKSPVLIEGQKKQQKKMKLQRKQLQARISNLQICFPDSIVSNAQSSELRSYYMSQLARTFSIFKVDEVLVLRDYSYVTKSNAFDAAAYIARNLQYLETPQYLRRHLFPIHPDLKNVGLMNPLECKHHFKADEDVPYREGVVVDRPSKDNSCWVEIGLKKYQQVKINYPLKPGTRVTVKLNSDQGEAVPSSEPKEKAGLYWGYQTKIISKLKHLIVQEDQFKILINQGDFDEFTTKNFEEQVVPHIQDKQVLIVFSGFKPVEQMIENDEKAKITPKEFLQQFDAVFSFQNGRYGVKQIRLEEEIFMILQVLRNYFD